MENPGTLDFLLFLCLFFCRFIWLSKRMKTKKRKGKVNNDPNNGKVIIIWILNDFPFAHNFSLMNHKEIPRSDSLRDKLISKFPFKQLLEPIF